MKNGVPIVFLYRGNRNFIPYTLFQACRSNPDSRVILLGDRSNAHYKVVCEHYDCLHYLKYSKLLREVYKHKSQWGEDFEFVCIERWFILYEFMITHEIDKCVILDSDILIFSNLTSIRNSFPDHDMTWTGFSAHINFIDSISALKQFCDFVFEVFSQHESYRNRLDMLYGRITSGAENGNISDMSFFHDFNSRYPGRLHNLALEKDGCMFDITIEMDQGMEMDGKFKKIIWNGKVPYAVNKVTKKLVRLHTIHFWTKDAIREFFVYSSFQFALFSTWCGLILFSQRLIRKLKLSRKPLT